MAGFVAKPIKPSSLYENLIEIFAKTPTREQQDSQPISVDQAWAERYPLRILLAEDNLVNQKVAIGLLNKMGYQPDVAATGIEVVEALNRQPYDLILMDIQMPEMDGVEAIERIKQGWTARDRPAIVAMTAHAMRGDREKYMNLGIQGYISKPVKVVELSEVLKKVQPKEGNVPVEALDGS
jgi:CheY-like chemotaxis protein